ncbi:hypothetical protein EWM64_g3250 [Hericium alpestre]|uniref:non-specific serine/threonine protein kinase n=1 Tax=Hericium alpestre TaxID=135208 RepID=A0A4Z0A3F0_9AGAM|nr:hypothetical protein EWM64_g3250 [Hericium alpestre]
MLYTNMSSSFDSFGNDPASFPRLLNDLRAASSGLQDVSSDCHTLHKRLCDSLEALAPFEHLEVSLKNGLSYAISTFLVRLEDSKEAKSPRAANCSFWLDWGCPDADSDLDEKACLLEDQELRAKLEYMDALLSAYSQRTLKGWTWCFPETPELVVSKQIIGHGSQGTAVLEGHLGAQRVAVKRMLKHFYSVPQRDLELIREASKHPNVLRYHYFDEDFSFVFIAMDYCSANLADIIKDPQGYPEIAASFRPKEALRQIASGLHHLHGLGMIHGNIHPRNVLVSGMPCSHGKAGYQMVLSDYILHAQMTFAEVYERSQCVDERGWLAPELLRGEAPIIGGSASGDAGMEVGSTEAVDIFALGCVFHYVLTEGRHPFGNIFEREHRIINNLPCIEDLRLLEDSQDAQLLVGWMLDSNAHTSAASDVQLILPGSQGLYNEICSVFICGITKNSPLDPSLERGLRHAIEELLALLRDAKTQIPGQEHGNRATSLFSLCGFAIDNKQALQVEMSDKRYDPEQRMVEQLNAMKALLSCYYLKFLPPVSARPPSPVSSRPPPSPPSLTVQKEDFAIGSHGALFFEGSFGEQRVVVKRMGKHFFVLDERELKLLRDAVPHPNLVRYYHVKENSDFYSIALDFCSVSLLDVIKRPQQHSHLSASLNPKRALRQVTSALQHLHTLGIVHCNIHARNVLVSETKDGMGANAIRIFVTDFCTYERMDFITRTGGWRERWYAAEILRGEVSLIGGPHDASIDGLFGGEDARSPTCTRHRFAPIDIFALGCLFYYVLSRGENPFGMFYEQGSNIRANRYSLDALDQGREGMRHAQDLIRWMLEHESSAR